MIWNGFRYFVPSISKKWSLLVLIFSILLATEIYFGWIEYLVGQWLRSHNDNRPELGVVWEIEHKKQIASDQLSKLINNRSSIQNGSVSFTHMLVSLSEGRGVMISYAHFVDFYRQLPKSVANKVFCPYLILKTASKQSWDRTYFEKIKNKINIYLLDSNNNILEQNNIKHDLLDFSSMVRPNFNGSIDDLPNFKNNVYSANVFFSVLSTLPENNRRNIINLPKKLINIDGEILRVGISDIFHSEKTIELGIEIEDSYGYRVVFFHGNLEDVNNIISIMNNWDKNSNLKSTIKQ